MSGETENETENLYENINLHFYNINDSFQNLMVLLENQKIVLSQIEDSEKFQTKCGELYKAYDVLFHCMKRQMKDYKCSLADFKLKFAKDQYLNRKKLPKAAFDQNPYNSFVLQHQQPCP